jgi:hypothetical protein
LLLGKEENAFTHPLLLGKDENAFISPNLLLKAYIFPLQKQ